MEYKLEYYAKEFMHGWTVWIVRDGQKFQLGSAIQTEEEVARLIGNIGSTVEPLSPKKKLEYALKEIEKLKSVNREMRNIINQYQNSVDISGFF